jgi:hypothetical protein
MSSTHLGIQRQVLCDTCRTIVALVLGERRLEKIKRLVEQRLARSPRPQDRQAPGGERRGGDRFDPAPGGKGDPFVDLRLRHEVERVGDSASGGRRDRPRVALVLEPSRRESDKVD